MDSFKKITKVSPNDSFGTFVVRESCVGEYFILNPDYKENQNWQPLSKELYLKIVNRKNSVMEEILND